jgi:glutathione S-transferase
MSEKSNMTSKTTEKTSLEIKRFIKAPPTRVYEAWTDPAQLREWFVPEGVRTRSFAADVRAGGKYRWDLVTEQGEDWAAFGEYRELIPGKKIVFTWQWDDDEAWQNQTSIVTVELFDRDGGTELLLTHERLPSAESRDRHSEGWNSLLNRLEQFLV